MTDQVTGNVGMVPARLVRAHGVHWAALAHAHTVMLADQWGLLLGAALPGSTLSLCTDAVTDRGTHVVLKVPVTAAAGRLEAAALTRFPALGTVQVLAADADTGAILMGFADHMDIPASPVQAERLARALHQAPVLPGDHAVFPALADTITARLAAARARHDSEPALTGDRGDVDRAEALIAGLLADAPDPVLLHGDYQAKNILTTRHGVLAIDPMPALGDPAFDIACWVATRPAHAAFLAKTLTGLHTPDRAWNDRLDRWTWALAVIESHSPDRLAWAWQREFVNTYRHLSDPD